MPCSLRSALLLLLFGLMLLPIACPAQEFAPVVDSTELADQGTQYLRSNIGSLSKYEARLQHAQKRLLHKLARKERKLLSRLKKRDSVAYQRLSQTASFDSLQSQIHPDSATLLSRTKGRLSSGLDSLKKIQAFVQGKIPSGLSTGLDGYTGKLDALNQNLSYQQYLSEQINNRTNAWKNLSSGLKDKIPAIGGLEKEVFYAKEKLKVWKGMADDPGKAEEQALEFLQGIEGFEGAFADKNADQGGMQVGMSAEQLEAAGFQTKRMLNQHLQQQFGSQLSGVQQQLGKQVESFTKPLKETTTLANETKQSLCSLKNTQRSSFKVNPERGKPFWQRLEKGYNLQTMKASGERPALLDIGGQVAFRHTPSLSYGLGIVSSFGLGRNWSNISFSLEGVGCRIFSQWEMKYGLGFYAGYERIFKKAAFGGQSEAIPVASYMHNTRNYSDIAAIGLYKKYRINSKWNGAIQVLWDVWWREKGLRAPILLRFTNSKF